MKTSARNQFTGTVLQVRHGAVNDEIEVSLDGSNAVITAIITCASTKNLGLATGKKAVVLVKASWVILMTDAEGAKFSARNQLPGVVVSIEEGAVNSEVSLRLDGGGLVTAIITRESAKNLGLAVGSKATALIKASHVILGAAV